MPMPTDFSRKMPMKTAQGLFATAQCVKFSRIAREIHAPNRHWAQLNTRTND